MERTVIWCDVYPDRPRIGLDDVLSTEITIKVAGDVVRTFGDYKAGPELVLCKKARDRLLNGIERLLKPPAKRAKGPADGQG